MARDRSKNHALTVTFTHLTEPQKLAIIDMLACWKFLGGVGSSRMVSFYADGDGDFHPTILVDGEAPKPYGTPEQVASRWKPDYHGTYTIDYDEIAGRLNRQSEVASYTPPTPPVYAEGCDACSQDRYLNSPTTDLSACQPSVIAHTCSAKVPRPFFLPGDLPPIPMNSNGGICECKHPQHEGECTAVIDEDPLPAGGTSKTYCRCKVFRQATLAGNLCLHEDCDSNHICFQVRDHKGPCFPLGRVA